MLGSLAAVQLYVRHRAGFWAVAIYAALSPIIHSNFIGSNLNDQHEYAFVRRTAELIPSGCTVLEFTGDSTALVDVRFDRAGAVLDGRTERRRFRAIPIGAPRGGASPLSQQTLTILQTPPACLYYYEGLFCHGRKERSEALAPACTEMHHAARLQEVARTRFPHQMYDDNLAQGIPEDQTEPIALRLYRVLE
jgi:hypothetical protein